MWPYGLSPTAWAICSGAIDQTRLDTQRGVVQNEKRQGENQPYGVTEELITKGTAPAGHPYSWTVIGSMEDLNAASLEMCAHWFKTYYGAGQRGAGPGRRHRPGHRAQKGGALFRRHPRRPAGRPV